MPTISGTDFAASLPESDIRAREQAVLEAIRQGLHLEPLWLELESRFNGHEARLSVMADAVRIGNAEDAIRVTLTAASAQRVADHFDAVLPTSRICDLVWAQARVRISPCTQTPDAKMAFTSRMLRHSREVDEKLRGRAGLVENVGKNWVLSNALDGKPGTVANYGWFRPNGVPIQTLGTRHDLHHVDYSQVVRLVRRDVVVDGRVRDIEEVGRDRALHRLISAEGPLRVWRLTGAEPQPLPPPDALPNEDPASWRILERGMKGTDVAAWQRVLMRGGHDLAPWNDDGAFGKVTHNTTVAWQRAHNLPATGIVDLRTRAAIGTHPIPKPDPTAELGDIPFVQAKNFTRANRTLVDAVVIHTMEAAEASTTAERVAAWAAGPNAPRASWHYAIDDDSIVQCVKEEDVAWAAPGCNGKGIQLEHAGFARQTAEQWSDGFSMQMLARSALLTARICKRWNVPIQFVDATALVRGERGITTHWEVTKGPGKGRTTHTDPGKHFPMARYIELVAEAAERLS
jgi:peptidoglycan hydrolase-like protein with peptidoglycan-binding domain/N-acetyl-anhydromuramyl-L-alanine amidase AmpD